MSPVRPPSSTSIVLLAPPGVSRSTLRRWTLAARRRLRLQGRLAIVTVRPASSRRLNRRYRRRDRPTNVLSFDYAHDQPAGKSQPIEGEVVLCPAVIHREAQEQGLTYRQYLRRLLEHGLIHLLGLDHRSPLEQRTWHTLEQHLA